MLPRDWKESMCLLMVVTSREALGAGCWVWEVMGEEDFMFCSG